jgi:hypothetical protein
MKRGELPRADPRRTLGGFLTRGSIAAYCVEQRSRCAAAQNGIFKGPALERRVREAAPPGGGVRGCFPGLSGEIDARFFACACCWLRNPVGAPSLTKFAPGLMKGKGNAFSAHWLRDQAPRRSRTPARPVRIRRPRSRSEYRRAGGRKVDAFKQRLADDGLMADGRLKEMGSR